MSNPPDGDDTIVVEYDLPDPPEKVWRGFHSA